MLRRSGKRIPCLDGLVFEGYWKTTAHVGEELQHTRPIQERIATHTPNSRENCNKDRVLNVSAYSFCGAAYTRNDQKHAF